MICNAHTHINSILRENFAVINGTQISDWQSVADICNKNSYLFPAFGLHPWFITDDIIIHMDNFLTALSNFLQLPHASLGEVGLDKNIALKIETQKQVLIKQLELADRFNLTTSIHCFGAFDRLLPILKKFNLKYVLHGYSGSPKITKELLNLDCYFSFGYIPQNRMEKIKIIMDNIPKDRILVETDGKENLNIENVAQTIIELKPRLNVEQLNDNFHKCFDF